MRAKTRNICLSALGAAIICLLAPVALPWVATPITLSVFAVFLVARTLPVGCAAAGTAVYVALGAAGLPVFAGFAGGFQVLAGPTGGFILAYIPAAVLVSLFRKNAVKSVVSMVASTTLCYIFGSLWMSLSTKAEFLPTLGAVAAVCILPDIIKIIAVMALSRPLRRACGALETK
jgi:biotin transport system substrate-specific component